MIRHDDKSPLSPLRLIAFALVLVIVFAALMVPLHRVSHAPPMLAVQGQGTEWRDRSTEASQVVRKAVGQAEVGFGDPPDEAAQKRTFNHVADHSPFGHQAGQDCEAWNAVFGADSFVTQPLGVIGPDAALTQKINSPRESQYARLSASPGYARGPPRC